jgi:putative ABC transport system substrate-binding protein
MGDRSNFASGGGLMYYAADQPSLYRGAAHFVDKIMKGANPAELPIELPTSFRLVVNQKTAQALGLIIPSTVRAQAAEVLQ